MCGITSFSLAENSSIHDLRSFTRCAVMAIEHRGTDATGFGWTLPDGQGRYWKEPMTAYQATRKAPLPREATVMLGHTRWGTSGPKSIPSNNHPVIDEGIMLIHNGVVNNEWAIYKMFDLPVPKQTVDTAAIALLLSNWEQLGADHVSEVLKTPTGSAALAWIDTADPHALHLARLQDRPLTLAWTRKGDMVMSSTPETLEHLSLMANIKFRKVTEVREGAYLKVVRGEIAETQTFTPRTWSSGYSSSGAYSSGQSESYLSKPRGELELVKDRGDAVTVPFNEDDLDKYDICRWDVEDIEVPTSVPFNPKAIRDWRYECLCTDCVTYEENKDLWKEQDAAFADGVEEFTYRGERMVWNREAGRYLPAEMAEVSTDPAELLELAEALGVEMNDNDPALLLEGSYSDHLSSIDR